MAVSLSLIHIYNHNFYFEKSGSNKGAGVTGEKDDKLYMSGMLLKADTDDKYQIIKEETSYVENKKKTTVYSKMDTDEFFSKVLEERSVDDDGSTTFGTVTKKNKDLKEAYNLPDGKTTANVDGRDDKGTGSITKYWLVNTSGKVIDLSLIHIFQNFLSALLADRAAYP